MRCTGWLAGCGWLAWSALPLPLPPPPLTPPPQDERFTAHHLTGSQMRCMRPQCQCINSAPAPLSLPPSPFPAPRSPSPSPSPPRPAPQLEPVSQASWQSGLGLAATELLAAGLAGQVADVEGLMALLQERAGGMD